MSSTSPVYHSQYTLRQTKDKRSLLISIVSSASPRVVCSIQTRALFSSICDFFSVFPMTRYHWKSLKLKSRKKINQTTRNLVIDVCVTCEGLRLTSTYTLSNKPTHYQKQSDLEDINFVQSHDTYLDHGQNLRGSKLVVHCQYVRNSPRH